MSGFAVAVATALYEKLASASPQVASGGVYNEPPKPEETTYPYVLIMTAQIIPDDVSSADGDTRGDDGVEEYFDLHVINQASSGSRGDLLIRQAFDRLSDLLHQGDLNVTGRASAHTWQEQARIFTESDGVTRRGIWTVRIIHRN